MAANRQNLVTNPRPEGLEHWVSTSGTLLEGVVNEGSPALKVSPLTPTTNSFYARPAEFQPQGGEWLAISAEIKALDQWCADNFRIVIQGISGNSTPQTVVAAPVTQASFTRVQAAVQVVGGGGVVRTQLWPTNTESVEKLGFLARRVIVTYGATQQEALDAVAHYFDGDSPRRSISATGSWYTHSWTGTPNASTSAATYGTTREWTDRWWESLPEVYKTLDVGQNLAEGGFPLRRWMDGPGDIGHGFRQISDDLYDGVYTDPDRAPDSAVRWLALMLGLPPAQRALPLPQLRARIRAVVTIGRTAVGTRAQIEEAVHVLYPGSVAWVRPSTTETHTLILYMRASDIPGEDTEAVRTAVLGTSTIPAGHQLVVEPASTSWDAWEAAAGTTWDEKEATLPTWLDSDSAGVTQI
ncbi:phage tail protein [Zhihengliuella halotolerans]|uniref:phage tail protein n=1 Tax=Zhihengliuella halotolerans TaxID=370736 RepID=UPI000C7F99ED|nr:phage tail protein [Zhihengliuella halotolerans]